MNTIDKLNRIKEICQANLEIAAKRTPGKWVVNSPGKDDLPCFTGRVNGEAVFAAANTLNQTSESNATFIATCAGAAEAGWKATIAAIEYIGEDAEIFAATTPRGAAARSQLDVIISAWEDQLDATA